MEWYQYLAAFFSGAFLANAVPHFIKGISGDKFPTPFAKPPGKGLSSATTNVLWALLNMVVGELLFKAGRVNYISHNSLSHLTCFVGFVVMSIMLSIRFQSKDKE
jgi:hypothetical protein